MDWKVFLMTFSAIFLAELADKTQLVGMGLSAKTGRPVSVWLGSVCAYIVVTAITVILGSLLGKYIRPEIIRYTGAAVFMIIALLMVIGKI